MRAKLIPLLFLVVLAGCTADQDDVAAPDDSAAVASDDPTTTSSDSEPLGPPLDLLQTSVDVPSLEPIDIDLTSDVEGSFDIAVIRIDSEVDGQFGEPVSVADEDGNPIIRYTPSAEELFALVADDFATPQGREEWVSRWEEAEADGTSTFVDAFAYEVCDSDGACSQSIFTVRFLGGAMLEVVDDADSR